MRTLLILILALIPVFFKETKSDFKTISFKKNQKIPRRNSKQKLQNMVKRKMTRMKLEIFCFYLSIT